MKYEFARKLAFRTLSQIGIHYPTSSLSQTLTGLPSGAPVAGDRFPWVQLKMQENGTVEDLFQRNDDTRFNLLLFGQSVPAGQAQDDLGGLLRIQVIPSNSHNDAELARVQVPQPSFYLLRPDGHVGLCGTRLDVTALEAYLAGRARLRVRETPAKAA
jgi:hypothetical protein